MTSAKLQRWTDLLAALLIRRHPVAFDDLSRDVPPYLLPKNATKKDKESLKRTFERDKAELLSFGVPLETIKDADGTDGYSLRPATFYLPYLALLQSSGRATPARRVDAYGYHALLQVAFEPDELLAIAAAAARVQALGEPLLASNARSAMTKLAFDLPQAAVTAGAELILTRNRPAAGVFPLLNQALLSRKRISFIYHSMAHAPQKRRTAEPLGLFFLNSHWYMAARDPGEATVKNFRLTRMRGVSMNTAKPQTPDFAALKSFSLREHAKSRQAWELGDADSLDAVVEFTATTGATSPALALGAAVDGHPTQRAFKIRRLDAFVRWVMGFGGAARPIAPPALVERFQQTVREALVLYGPRP